MAAARVDEALAGLTPMSTWRVVWPPAAMSLAAYLGSVTLPDDLVTSVRCLVFVRGQVVVCETPNDTHIMPGGRRESAETFEQTACREVHEETGWLLEPSALRPLGFLHFHVLDVLRPEVMPHVDFLQVVFTAEAREHATPDNAASWVDSAGWEERSWLADPTAVADLPILAAEHRFLEVAVG